MQTDLQQIDDELSRIQSRRRRAADIGDRVKRRMRELELDAQADELKAKRNKLLHVRAS